jgi:hypothetical protein
LVAVVAITAGCSVPGVDALQIPEGESAEVCTPSNEQGRATVGVDFLTNTAPD